MSSAKARRRSGEAEVVEDSRRNSGSTLSESYRTAIARLEALEQNQSGSDKSWVEDVLATSRRHFACAVRIR